MGPTCSPLSHPGRATNDKHELMGLMFEKVELIVGKGAKAAYQHFSVSKNDFKNLLPKGLNLMHQQQTAFENIVGKEEIARNEQSLLFPQYFILNQKIVSPRLNIHDIISLFAAELEKLKIDIRGEGLKR